MAASPSAVTVRIRERKTNRILADVSPGFTSVQWIDRWRRFGTGVLRIESEALPREALDAILDGNGAVNVIREWDEARPGGGVIEHTDTVDGPVLSATVRDGDFMQARTDWGSVRNEIVVLGANEAAARDIERRYDTTSQDSLGCRELAVDARHLSTTAEYQARGDAELDERLEPQRVLTTGGARSTGLVWEIRFADNRVYLDWRVVDCDGVASVDPGNVAAGVYIEDLVSDNLIAPTLAAHGAQARRMIDVPTTFVSPHGIGSVLDLPVRWKLLSEVVRLACAAGAVGLKASVNSNLQIEYEVLPLNDRTGGSNAVIWSRDNAEANWDVRPGDQITVEEYLREDSTSPDIGPLTQLCLARTITLSRGAPDRVRLDIGGEVPSEIDLIRGASRRSEEASFS